MAWTVVHAERDSVVANLKRAVKQTSQTQLDVQPTPTLTPSPPTAPTGQVQSWTKGICPNCGYAKADVDPEGILWCPACGYSKKGCYT